MKMNNAAGAAPDRRPHIGAFVLETLTLGMYGEPRHTLREYVQNSFDAIRSAHRLKFLSGRGRVDVTLASDAITIRDNGLGVRADLAWSTLTSIGASKKDRQRDAGFRGIGRLAGMAYCEVLTFRTTFPGETVVSTVSFDCAKLLEAMDPDEGGDMELANLLAEATTFRQEEGAAAKDHFFEVKLIGLERAPESLTNAQEVSEYLSATVPVDFAPPWSHRGGIESEYKSYFGGPIETIDVFVTAESTTTQIYKPYGDNYERAHGMAQLETVQYYNDEKNNSYWGWVGQLSGSGAVTDGRTRGLRVRVRNIQVGGTEIFEALFTRVKPSYGRFSSYYVGEIHLDPERVVPNARRDGFEETLEWIGIKDRLVRELCGPLAKGAYQASQAGQTDVQKVVDDIDRLAESSHSLTQNSRATYDQVVGMMNTAKRLRRRAAAALKAVGDLDDTTVEMGGRKDELHAAALQEAARTVETVESNARMLVGQFLGEDERLSALKHRLRQEVVAEVLDIVGVFVDPQTYQKIKRQLLKLEK
jgi:Histidine kinase-, DNA gyrase B-, and HSP90-like ATPase